MIEVNDKTFKKEILENKKTVITMFHATYCPFCTRFMPIFEKSSKNPNKIFATADITDDNNPLWETYNINHVPSIVAFKDGKEIGRRNAAAGIGLIEADLQNLIKEI